MFSILFALYQHLSCTLTTCQNHLASGTTPPMLVAAKVNTYQAPIVITKGGTYSGNWQSLKADVPAVTIRTSEPVVIENSKIRGRGHLIDASNSFRTNVTVRNTYGYGLNPKVAGRVPGRFLKVYMPGKIVVENCYMQSTSGINIANDGSISNSISVKIRYNKALNLDGRKSDGKNGFLKEFEVAQFVILDALQQVPGIEISWNQAINEPYKSSVEDNINIYNSSGTASSPISIHNNYIKGGYPVDPVKDTEYTGGGIMLGDGGFSTTSLSSAFVKAYQNQVVNTANHGMAIASGHDIQFYDNRIVSSGHLADGTYPPAAKDSVGIYIWDYYGKKAKGKFYNNYAYGNAAIGWIKADGSRNDTWFPDCESGKCTNNKSLPNPVTLDTEKAEFQLWLDKVARNKIKLGPNL